MEIVLKINSANNDPKNYQDGDIVQTFTNDHIHMCHAEMICSPKHFSFNTFGLRDRNTLLEKFMEKTLIKNIKMILPLLQFFVNYK